MADDDELRLNELSRFRKTSKRLALEAHSHCEVPAGCGGVVLRWRRPGAPVGVLLMKYCGASAEGYCLDGQPLGEQRTQLEPGDHVLSFTVDDPGYDGLFMLKLTLDPVIVTARRDALVSSGDGRARAALTEPPEGWRLPGFDDSSFTPLVERAVSEPKDNKKWMHQMLARDAKGLGLPEPQRSGIAGFLSSFRRPNVVKRVWVRWVFHVDHEGFS